MLGNLVEDILSNWSAARDTVLAVKDKMVEMHTQLTTLDNTFDWNYMAGVTSPTLQPMKRMLP